MIATSTTPIHIGTSGWYYLDWLDNFYPRRLPKNQWFAHYSATFASVELNSTFYRVPDARMFRTWAEKAPPGFVFGVKAPRDLTHRHDRSPNQVLEELTEGCRLLGEHRGPILYQWPPWVERSLHRLDSFLGRLPRGFDHVIEFRHASWYEPEVERLLTAAGVGFCIHDMQGCASPAWLTGGVGYYRLHGPTVKYMGRYGTSHLRTLADRLLQSVRPVRKVYVFFNNTMAGAAVADALELSHLLAQETSGDSPTRFTSSSPPDPRWLAR